MAARDDGGAVGSRVRRGPGRKPGRPVGGQLVADRAQLLEAAERAIRAEGPSVTLEAIAAEAQVTKPILYRGVGDKDDLVQGLAERLVDRINEAVTAAVVGGAGPRDQLQRFVAAYLEVVESDRNVYLYVTAGGSSDDRVRQALHLADRSAQPLAEGLAEQRMAAGADPSVALAWSYGLIGMLHFVTLWWMRDPVLSAEQVADAMTELLWSGLRGSAPPRRRRRAWTRS